MKFRLNFLRNGKIAKWLPGFRKKAAQNPVIERPNQVTERKSGSSHLMYTKEFREFLKSNPGVIRDFMQARKLRRDVFHDLLRGSGHVISVGKVRVTTFFGHWKVEVGDKVFFVKEERDLKFHKHSGTAQFMAYQRLEPILPENIEIAKYHLGWTHRRTAFIVTDFYDPKTFSKDDMSIPSALKKEYLRFAKKARKIGIADIVEHNAFYDKKRNKIIVFDPFFKKVPK